MNRFIRLLLTATLLHGVSARSANVTVLNLAIFPADREQVVAIDAEGASHRLSYRQHLVLDLDSSGSLRVSDPDGVESAMLSLGAIAEGDMILVFGGINNRPLRLRRLPWIDDPGAFGQQRCEPDSGRCLDLFIASPVPTDFWVSGSIDCRTSTFGSGGSAGGPFGDHSSYNFGQGPDAIETVRCSLMDLATLDGLAIWPEARNIEVRHGVRSRVFVTGDGDVQPLDFLWMLGDSPMAVETVITGLGRLPVHENAWRHTTVDAQGLVIHWLNDRNTLFGIHYFHDADGEARWRSVIANRVGSERFEGSLYASQVSDGGLVVNTEATVTIEIDGINLLMTLVTDNATRQERFVVSTEQADSR